MASAGRPLDILSSFYGPTRFGIGGPAWSRRHWLEFTASESHWPDANA
jgi:hypothetical protein